MAGRDAPARNLGRGLAAGPALIAGVATLAIAVAGCGSSSGSSGSATALLRETFSGAHTVDSGMLDFTLTITPTDSKLLTGPVTLSLSGPFQSRGAGKLPASDFTVAITAMKLHGALSVISTGTRGYVTMSGTSYQLPQSSFRKLESGFAAAEAPAGGSSSAGSSTLTSLGINPLHWLSDPTIVGQQPVGGTETTHLRAKVDVRALLADISRVAVSSKLNVAGAANLSSGISASSQARIAGELGSPSFDLWTGNSDKTVRKLSLVVQLPVTGATRTSLGGMTEAKMALTLQYSDLNKPQTITAPTHLEPYRQFQAKVDSLLAAIGSAVSTGASSTTSTTSTTPASSSGSTTTDLGSSLGDQKYSDCITKAAGDVKKMQKCTSLLGGG